MNHQGLQYRMLDFHIAVVALLLITAFGCSTTNGGHAGSAVYDRYHHYDSWYWGPRYYPPTYRPPGYRPPTRPPKPEQPLPKPPVNRPRPPVAGPPRPTPPMARPPAPRPMPMPSAR